MTNPTSFSKRTKITLTAVFLAVGVFLLPSVPFESKYLFIFFLMVSTYGLSFWSLKYQLKKIEYVTLFVLPVLICLDACLIFLEFERFFQTNFFLKLMGATGIGILTYVTLLVENIFNVSSGRSIPLLRAGHTVGYLATLVVVFLQAALLYNLNLSPWFLVGLIFISMFTLFLQALWQTELEEHITFDIALSSFIFAIICSQIALAFSFWPLNPLSFGLTQASTVYLLLGLKQHQIKNNLSKQVVREYLLMGFSIFALLLFVTGWRN